VNAGQPVFQIQDALQSGKEDAGHGIKRVLKNYRIKKEELKWD
jgi:hypothetical protein